MNKEVMIEAERAIHAAETALTDVIKEALAGSGYEVNQIIRSRGIRGAYVIYVYPMFSLEASTDEISSSILDSGEIPTT